MRELRLAHVLLAAAGNIGLYVTRAGEQASRLAAVALVDLIGGGMHRSPPGLVGGSLGPHRRRADALVGRLTVHAMGRIGGDADRTLAVRCAFRVRCALVMALGVRCALRMCGTLAMCPGAGLG